MADEFGDGEFWLPSEFLSEDVVLGKSSSYAGGGGAAARGGVWFPSEFPYGGSDLGSPVESVVGSTETESDGEDYAAGAVAGELSRRLSGSLLLDDLLPGHGWDAKKPKANLMSSSPQSPLCAMGSWCQYGHGGGSSRGSPNGPSQLSSPPSTPYTNPDDAWELLSAAAGQVVRLKLNEEAQRGCGRGLLGVPPRKPASTGFFSNPAFAQQQLQSAKLLQLQKQQWGVRGRQGGVCSKNGSKGGRQPYCLSSTAWPPSQSQPQQQQPCAGMRAVFLGGGGGGGSRRESAGTGVFLPRRPGTPTDLRKKPACSTVLVPARVVQALNLNLDEMGSAHPRLPPTFARQSAHYRDQWPARSDVPLSMFQKNAHSVPPASAISPEFRLPPEWTY